MKPFLFITTLLLLLSISVDAQVADSSHIKPNVMDSKPKLAPKVGLELPKAYEPKVFDPKKALLWSIIPGGGQVYNRRWWKVPLVFSSFTGIAAVLNFNNSNYQRFEEAYQLELAGLDHEFTGVITGSARLKVFRDNFNKSRQSGYFYLIGIYLLQGVEAYVDAELRNFDIDEDLSQFQLQPILIPPTFTDQSPTLALALRYTF